MARPRSCGMGPISHLCTLCRGQKTEAQSTYVSATAHCSPRHPSRNQPDSRTLGPLQLGGATEDRPARASSLSLEEGVPPSTTSWFILSLNQTKHHWAGQRCRHGFWTQQPVSLVVGSLIVFHLPISALTLHGSCAYDVVECTQSTSTMVTYMLCRDK